jgi:hypothetical protein
MKSLTRFIKENNENVNVIFNDVTVTFIPFAQHGGQKGIVFELPKDATSDTIQLYLNQCIVPYLPGGDKNEDIKKFIGININSITDINLTYEDVEKDPAKFHLTNKQTGVIKFDETFGQVYANKLEEIMLTGIKFTLSFSQFTLENISEKDTETEEDCKGLLEDQFINIDFLGKTSKFPLRFQNVEYSDCSIDEV